MHTPLTDHAFKARSFAIASSIDRNILTGKSQISLMNLATIISRALCLAFMLSPSPATASADNAADETVAAGIVFKLTYLKNFATSAGVPSWVYQQKPKSAQP